MEVLLILGLIIVLIIRWAVTRDRMSEMESSIKELRARLDAQGEYLAELRRKSQAAASASPAHEKPPIVSVPAQVPEPAPEPEPVKAIEPVPPRIAPPVEAPQPQPAPQPAPAAASREWESVLGGNWLNKLGVFVLVIGLALLLSYSFTKMGPVGRVTICLAASLALLATGVVFESRERYRMFARGLLGGGWAALYVTVYAMHSVEAARVVENPVMAAFLLMAVAAGMIVHSLRYRAQTVTGLAYFVAFGTLAITDTTSLPFMALIPLAASLLYVAHRFGWAKMTLLGLIATYAVVIARGDTGAPLWKAQTVFAVYWLLFEIFDILHAEAWLLPLNAAGFLGLSILKWQKAAPENLWILLAVSAAAYAVSGLARVRSKKWHGAATLTAALAAWAIFQRVDRQWIASALVVEAELFYLAGIRLRAPFLRWLGTGLFGLEALRLLVFDMLISPQASWAPVASLDIAIFYANRMLYAADQFYGYAAAGFLALLIGRRVGEPYRSLAWQTAAVGAFAVGWWRRLRDFRLQGYFLLAVGLAGAAAATLEMPFAMAALICYAAALCALWSAADRLGENERSLVRIAGAALAVASAMALVWKLAPGEYLGIAWMALALAILELGLRQSPGDFRRFAYAAALIAAFRIWVLNVAGLHNSGPWSPRLIPLWAALAAYAIAVRARREERGLVLVAGSSVGMAFGMAALWALLPAQSVAASWAAVALALLFVARQWPETIFVWQSCAAAAGAFVLALAGMPDNSAAVWATCAAIACFYGAQMLSERTSGRRLYFSLLGTTLLTLLLYYRISGSLLTMAGGIEGVILLASGFPLRDRVLRVSGLSLLLACILKLFVWDLRHLETLPRIFSFIVLGIILLAVSWAYTRFKEQFLSRNF